MKRLFREEYETYTEEAVKISQEMGVKIRKMIDYYCNDKGYSINDIQHILLDEVSLNCSEFKILRNMRFRKGKKNVIEKL